MMKPLIKLTTIGQTTIYSAWEPGKVMGNHTSITRIDEEWYGQIGSRMLPAELEALPAYTQERLDKVQAWQEAQYTEAYHAIREEVEVPGSARYSMGEISWTEVE